MHCHLDLRAGDRLLDLACSSGLALELAASSAATVSGTDAPPRLILVSTNRCSG